MGNFLSKAPHKIVILRALQLGDLLCSMPAFRALRSAYPNARISLVGLPWAAAFVQRFSRYLDDFIPFPGWPGLPESDPQIHRIPAFLENVQSQRFDLALQMQGAGTITNPLVALFGARQSAGFSLPGQYRPANGLFPEYPEDEHEIQIFLKLMNAIGIPSQGDELEFPVTDAERQAFAQFRAEYGLESGGFVCLHPGARFDGRRLPPKTFAAIGDALARMGYQVVVTGTDYERALTGAVVRRMHTPAFNAAGKTSLGVLALLLSEARLLVSNDTGVSHIAAALKTPSIILFTASEANRWRPLNHQLHRAILNANQVPPEAIVEEAQDLLREVGAYAQQPL